MKKYPFLLLAGFLFVAQVSAQEGASLWNGLKATEASLALYKSGLELTHLSSPVISTQSTQFSMVNSTPARPSMNWALSYGLEWADKWFTQFQVNYHLGATTAYPHCLSCTANAYTHEQNNAHYQMLLTPSYTMNASGMAYLKLGYTRSNNTASSLEANSFWTGAKSGSRFYGLGYKHFYKNDVYGFAEYSYSKNAVDASLPTNKLFNPSNPSTFHIGFGYRF